VPFRHVIRPAAVIRGPPLIHRPLPISGCLGTDVDFDGPNYQNTWPGTFSNASQGAQFHSSPITFTSPVFNGGSNYDRVAFEADLPPCPA